MGKSSSVSSVNEQVVDKRSCYMTGENTVS